MGLAGSSLPDVASKASGSFGTSGLATGVHPGFIASATGEYMKFSDEQIEEILAALLMAA
jgi:hypothetical protein